MSASKVPQGALILAGGEGRRLRPLTNEIPKPLVKVNAKPILEYSILELEKNGTANIILSIGYKGEKIVEYLDSMRGKFKSNISLLKEDTPLGTGGAIKLALEKYKFKDITVVNGDNIFEIDLGSMYDVHKKNSALITMALVRLDDVCGKGIVLVEGEDVVEFIEKPDPDKAKSNITNAGIYIISKRITKLMPKTDSFSFERDVIPRAIERKERICAFMLNELLSINTAEQLNDAQQKLKRGT